MRRSRSRGTRLLRQRVSVGPEDLIELAAVEPDALVVSREEAEEMSYRLARLRHAIL